MENLFINREIFDADNDYVIGGFYTDNTELKFSDFVDALQDKISDLVQDYLDEAFVANIEMGYKEEAQEKANQNLGLLLKDNLDILVPYVQANLVADEIFNHPKIEKWLFKTKQNFDSQQSSQKINLNKFDSVSEKQKEIAEYFTNTTLEKWLESVSTIEL